MTTAPPAPTLTADNNSSPCPRIEVLITPMPTGVTAITIYRQWGTTQSVVRGAVNAPVSGDFLVIDYEAPLGVPVTYTAIGFDSGGIASVVSATSSAVTMASTAIWLQDPLNPTSAVAIQLSRYSGAGPWLMAATMDTLTYAQGIQYSPVVGGPLPFSAAGTMQAASNVPLVFTSKTSDPTTATIRTLIQTAFPILLRVPPRVPALPALSYLGIASLTEAPDLTRGVTVWSLTGQSIMGPGLNVLVSPRTWNTVAQESSTWTGIAGLYAQWINVQRGY